MTSDMSRTAHLLLEVAIRCVKFNTATSQYAIAIDGTAIRLGHTSVSQVLCPQACTLRVQT